MEKEKKIPVPSVPSRSIVCLLTFPPIYYKDISKKNQHNDTNLQGNLLNYVIISS